MTYMHTCTIATPTDRIEVMQPFHTPPRKGPEPKNMVKYHIIKLSTPNLAFTTLSDSLDEFYQGNSPRWRDVGEVKTQQQTPPNN